MDKITPKTVSAEMISCDICLKEIPAEAEEYAETGDYVHHFCGIECYKQWQQLQEADD